MSTVHQLCKEFRFISDRVATLKLPVVVLQEAKIYLERVEKADLLKFKEEGVSFIWEKIKINVADRMFGEFGSLYENNKKNAKFKDFVAAGIYVDLTKKKYQWFTTWLNQELEKANQKDQSKKIEELPQSSSKSLASKETEEDCDDLAWAVKEETAISAAITQAKKEQKEICQQLGIHYTESSSSSSSSSGETTNVK